MDLNLKGELKMKPNYSVSWSDIKVGQFQELYKITSSDLDPLEKAERAICILFNITDEQLDEMPISKFNSLSKQVEEVLNGQIPGKPLRFIRTGKRKYRVQYKVSELSYGQYSEINSFSKNIIRDLHFLAASIVVPVDFLGRKLKEKRYHKDIAADMTNARLIDIYHSCVFFCQVLESLMRNCKPRLIAQAVEQGATREQITELIDYSLNNLVSSIPPKRYRYLKV